MASKLPKSAKRPHLSKYFYNTRVIFSIKKKFKKKIIIKRKTWGWLKAGLGVVKEQNPKSHGSGSTTPVWLGSGFNSVTPNGQTLTPFFVFFLPLGVGSAGRSGVAEPTPRPNGGGSLLGVVLATPILLIGGGWTTPKPAFGVDQPPIWPKWRWSATSFIFIFSHFLQLSFFFKINF